MNAKKNTAEQEKLAFYNREQARLMGWYRSKHPEMEGEEALWYWVAHYAELYRKQHK
jgi:hypothetical protein